MLSTFGIQTMVMSFQLIHLSIVPRKILISLLAFFAETHTHNINIICDDSTFGLVIDFDEISHRAFIIQISTK